jgi:drug/metabolite transporter (DMT)-like permease
MFVLSYLIVFGSCIAYGAYTWLVHEVTPARLGTYAYVNPAVAVVLGWWILGESLTRAQVLGTIVILGGVVIVTLASRKRAAH